ncbi:MAG: hypothetical protein A3B68_09590 [Candidatus Melainabacteria bacterium RIFCSPHIGHO2_02_FULL_34_12]|nr:MAG: hypothetical protein A3B68_09590 [Candidatus Melainabacteria bacterium RIFCSPHIGHO2_02_FULL_34_12]
MKTVKISIPLVLALILYTAFSYATYAESGSDKYTPTKLEWLMNYLNSYSNSLPRDSYDCLVRYEPKPPNTVNVTIIYGFRKCPSKTEAETTLSLAEGTIREFAHKKNWNWVNTQGELKEISQARQEGNQAVKESAERALQILIKDLGKDHPEVKDFQQKLNEWFDKY